MIPVIETERLRLRGHRLEDFGASAVMKWGLTRFGAARAVCLINPENAASVRVAEKCGFTEWQRSTYKGAPVMIFVDSSGR